MQKLVIDQGRCPQNHPCPSVKLCPQQALRQEGHAAPVIDEERCVACGLCAKSCAMRALRMVEIDG